jgi:hypothetical protein
MPSPSPDQVELDLTESDPLPTDKPFLDLTRMTLRVRPRSGVDGILFAAVVLGAVVFSAVGAAIGTSRLALGPQAPDTLRWKAAAISGTFVLVAGIALMIVTKFATRSNR